MANPFVVSPPTRWPTPTRPPCPPGLYGAPALRAEAHASGARCFEGPGQSGNESRGQKKEHYLLLSYINSNGLQLDSNGLQPIRADTWSKRGDVFDFRLTGPEAVGFAEATEDIIGHH